MWPTKRNSKPKELPPAPEPEPPHDDAWVQAKIDGALERFDAGPNLVKPLYGQLHHTEIFWHRKQVLEIMGGLAAVIQNGKSFGLAVLGVLVILAALLVHQDSPIYADLIFPATLGLAMYLAIGSELGYKIAFMPVHVLEFLDYTDPWRPTAHIKVWLLRLGFFHRSEDWAGTDGRSGLLDSDAYMLLALPVGVSWRTLQTGRDFYDLRAVNPTLEGTHPRMRRNKLREIAANGSLVWLIKQLHRNQDQLKVWIWALAGGGIILAGVLLLMLAPAPAA